MLINETVDAEIIQLLGECEIQKAFAQIAQLEHKLKEARAEIEVLEDETRRIGRPLSFLGVLRCFWMWVCDGKG